MRLRQVPLLAFVLALAAACGGGEVEERPVSAYPDSLRVDRVLIGGEFAMVVRGVRYGRVSADSMYLDEDSSTARLFGLQLQLRDTAGNQLADLRSDRGRFDLRTQLLAASRNAVLVRPNGARIEADELHVDPESHRIWSDAATRVYWPGGGSTTYDSFSVDDRFLRPEGTNPRGPRGARL